MKPYITILFFLTASKFCLGQKYAFSPDGVMGSSQLYVDTVIKTKLKLNGNIVFNSLDNFYSDTLSIKQFFPEKFNSILQDTLEFYFVANLSKKIVHFKTLNDRLVAEEMGNFEGKGYRPISLFLYPSCGTGINYEDLILKPGEILIIKSLDKRQKTSFVLQPNCLLKLLLAENKVLVSSPYRKIINKNAFYINSTIKDDFIFIERRIAFSYR